MKWNFAYTLHVLLCYRLGNSTLVLILHITFSKIFNSKTWRLDLSPLARVGPMSLEILYGKAGVFNLLNYVTRRSEKIAISKNINACFILYHQRSLKKL